MNSSSNGINTEILGKEMELMCNLSGLVLEEGIQQGSKQTLNRLSILSKKLQVLGKVDDLVKATTD